MQLIPEPKPVRPHFARVVVEEPAEESPPADSTRSDTVQQVDVPAERADIPAALQVDSSTVFPAENQRAGRSDRRGRRPDRNAAPANKEPVPVSPGLVLESAAQVPPSNAEPAEPPAGLPAEAPTVPDPPSAPAPVAAPVPVPAEAAGPAPVEDSFGAGLDDASTG